MWKDDLTKSIEEYKNSKTQENILNSGYASEECYSYQDPEYIYDDNPIATCIIVLLFLIIALLSYYVYQKNTSDITYSNTNNIVYDNIEYHNLTPGREYKVKSSIVNKETGEVLSEELVSFYPDESSGEFEVEHQIPEGEYIIYESLDWEE